MAREEVAYIEKLVAINRVAKVVKGGKRFSFSALVIVGDGKGRVGYAGGKAREVADAVKKATEKAKKSMVRIPMREGRTLHHDICGRYGAGKVVLRSAEAGIGIIAGGAMRSVFEALGMQDVVSKCLGSANPHNMVRATFNALLSTVSPKYIASKRGKRVGEISSRRHLARQ
jgi:small subunit ribosomal protein S5